MPIFRKPLIEWREPDEVARARREANSSLRFAKWAMIGCLALGAAGIVGARFTLNDRGARQIVRTAAWLIAPALASLALWVSKRDSGRLAIYASRNGRGLSLRRRVTVAAIARYPDFPQYRALVTVALSGRKRTIAVPEDVCDEDIVSAWKRSEQADVPLQFIAGTIPVEDPPHATGEAIFQWPSPPSYWPTRSEVRRRILFNMKLAIAIPTALIAVWAPLSHMLASGQYRFVIGAVTHGIAVSTVMYALMAAGMVVPGFLMSLAICACAGAGIVVFTLAAGAFFGWNQERIEVREDGISFGGVWGEPVSFAWPAVRAVRIRMLADALARQEISVLYDYHGLEPIFVRTVSRRFDYERFVAAVATKTDRAPEPVETPDCVTIVITGFGEKAAAGR
jgi:hypothetical protein